MTADAALGPRPAPAWRQLLAVRLVSQRPEALARFFIEGLGFRDEGGTPLSAADLDRLGVSGAGFRRRLRFGAERLQIDAFDTMGAPYPDRACASDIVFQHFALVTSDIESAYQRALAEGARAISSQGPVRLPAASGGVTAVKFRDPEGHPLEFIQASGAGSAPRLDHSAISVSDLAASLEFYQARGLKMTSRTLNQGAAQSHLDGLLAPQVDVVGLAPLETPPHLELLAYHASRGAPALSLQTSDCAATRLVWRGESASLVRDPDGHLHEITPSEAEAV